MKLEGFATLLQNTPGLSLTPGVNLFVYSMPANVDRGVALLAENPWAKADQELIGKHSGRLQVVVRDNNYSRGEATAYAVRDVLMSRGARTLGSIYIYYCVPSNAPLVYPRANSDLIEWSTSFDVHWRELP